MRQQRGEEALRVLGLQQAVEQVKGPVAQPVTQPIASQARGNGLTGVSVVGAVEP